MSKNHKFSVNAEGKNWSTSDYMFVFNNSLGCMSDDNKLFLFRTEKKMNKLLEYRANRKN